jgi:hypothetical protein
MSKPKVVCVLGMHRSGTSLVARVLNVLGLELGPEEHLMRPASSNPAGHWESRPIKELNDEILSRLGGSWSEPPELAPGWQDAPELGDLRERARELIEADFSDYDLWGFKDPRCCLTAPFWQRLLPPMRYVICLRNPLDVAASLHARKVDSMPVDRGALLWLTYMRAALAATAGQDRHLVFYEDLMADPKPAVRRLAKFIGRHKSKDARAEARLAIRVAMSEGLWHHRTAASNVVDASLVPFNVKAFYVALRLSVPRRKTAGTEMIDLLGAQAVDAGRRLARLEQLLSERRADLERLRAARQADLERLRSEHRAEVERLASSRTEEERRRRRLEAELEAAREELRRLQEPPEPVDESTGPSPGASAGASDPLVAEIKGRVRELIPDGATVLVAGKGDDALLQLGAARAWHFPMAEDGRYAGYHPAGDTAAIAQLEGLRARGADHLLLPATTLWWLDHYRGLRRHLEERYLPLVEDERCAIFRLAADGRRAATGPLRTLERVVAALRMRSGRDPSILDWNTGLELAAGLPEVAVFAPPDEEEPALPYLDRTVDVVVLASESQARIAEACRVAAGAVIKFDPGSPERSGVEWLAAGASGWGEDVCVTLIPAGDGTAWEATIGAVAETLDDGFAGELRMIGEAATLAPATARAAASGVRLRAIDAAPGASVAERARTAIAGADHRLHVFVTAPGVPLPNWLPSLLALFSTERNAGVVGARILTSLGSLAEAGGSLAPDGSHRHRGAGDHDPDRPEYRYVRRVDFCSPPLLATSREVFERNGGFDGDGTPPAEAAVAFALRAGRAGAAVYYQPQARVIALGSASR